MAGDTPILISACLLGIKTRYDGTSATDAFIMDIASSVRVVPVCPEQLGGLPTPRPRAEITGAGGALVLSGMARVIDETGRDVTSSFMAGAEAVAEIARITGAKEAYLKEKSPSCGVRTISCRGTVVEGSGVTAALLKARGIRVKGF